MGDVADAIGFPTVENGFLTLTRGEVRDSAHAAPVAPALFTWRQLALGGNDGHSRVFDLISVEGQVVTEVRQATQDEYVLNPTATCSPPSFAILARQAGSPSNPMSEIPLGTRIRVTGICMLADANPFNGEVPFNILMRDVDDIVDGRSASLAERASPHADRRPAALVWSSPSASEAGPWSAGFARRAAALAYLEQRRSRILEDINNSRPLSEIIECITEVVSFRLHGAACWCEIADGALSGQAPAEDHLAKNRPAGDSRPFGSRPWNHLRRHQPPHQTLRGGDLSALLWEQVWPPWPLKLRASTPILSTARSSTCSPTFPTVSLWKSTWTRMISDARRSAGIFGFIFIDLDQFKQVNDQIWPPSRATCTCRKQPCA